MVFALLNVMAVMAVTLRGNVTDLSGESLIQASVRVLAAKDSSLVKGAVTNAEGRFNVANVKAGKYVVEISYVGYETQMRNVTVADKDITLKPFQLKESSVMLQEAVVRGVRTPITVKEDTVEFNAESYKTQPNAVVEDLLKRLPGVEVDSDGKITANGKSISKILVDGKEFFANDPTVASRNLPADMLEKVQVVDRKSDLARLTGVDDGEEETVINLSVKKNMKNGWFGNAEAGYGSDDRYNGKFNVNRFWNENQITFLGGANNINRPAADGGGGGFRRFGGNNGINKSEALGLNFNVGNGDIFRVGGDVMYNHSDRNTRTESERTYIFTDSTSSQYSRRYSRDRGHNINANFRIQWKPDSFNTLDFRPEFSLNYNNSNSNDSTSMFSAAGLSGREVTRSINNASAKGNSYSFSGRLIYNHNFKSHRGRSFSIMANYRLSNTREKEDTYSFNKFFLLNDSVDLYDQYADNHTWSNSVSTRVSWTEPLGDVRNGNFLVLSYNFSYRWNNADKLTYDHPVTFPDGWDGIPVIDPELVFNEKLSNRYRNDYMNQNIRIGYRKVTKNANLQTGIAFVPQMNKSVDLIDHNKDISRSVLNYAPFLRYRYRLNKLRSLQVNYEGRSSQPSVSQLQPVADMSDPLRIVIGNPDLDPSFAHNLSLRFQDFNADKQRSIMVMLDGSMTQNSIVSRTSFNRETGGQITTYTNVNGVWNVRAMNMFSMPLPFCKTLQFDNHISASYNSSVGFNNDQRNRSGLLNINESFGLKWFTDYVEFMIRPRYNYQNTVNSVQKAANRSVHTYGGSFYGTYNIPIGIVISTDVNYSATSGYSSGFDTKTWMWNASLSYQFLHDRNMSVTLSAYDILGQRSNIRRNITASYIDDSRYNSLTRYVMLSLSYKFNTFGKNGRRNNAEEWEGPGTGDRGGRGERRQGPPPGGGRPGGPAPMMIM